MFIAIVLGVIAGVVSYLPYILATAKSTKTDVEKGIAGLAGWFFFAILGSFIILFACIALCAFLARDVALPFTLSSVIALVTMVFIFSLIVPRQKSRRSK